MEGPSLYLAAKQLSPFSQKKILKVEGNTRIGKERLSEKDILDIFSWGKHLVFQFDTFALRVHFMLYGSFQATVEGDKVTGDYPRKARAPRLKLTFDNGEIDIYSASLRYIEEENAKDHYDYTIDIMSDAFGEKKALKSMKSHPESEISDVLLDQTLFAGIGNIIRNEVLFRAKILPTRKVGEISPYKLKQIIKIAREYVFQFYEWRKKFVLRKHYEVYKKSLCPRCSSKITRKKTGRRARMSHFCAHCQK